MEATASARRDVMTSLAWTIAVLNLDVVAHAATVTSSYSPSKGVKLVRGVPRIGFNLERNRPTTFALAPNTFYVSSNPYLQSIITFPAILLAAAIVAFVVVPTVLVTRYFLQCSSCAPEASDQYLKYALQPQKWSREVATNRRTLLVFFWLGFSIAVCGAHLLWYGAAQYDPAVSSLRSSVQYVQGQYARVESIAQTFIATTGTMYVGVDQSPCRFANTSAVFGTERGLISLAAASQSLYDAAYGLPFRLGQMDAYLSTYGQQAKLIAVASGYAWATFVCLLSALAVGLRNKAFTQVAKHVWPRSRTSPRTSFFTTPPGIPHPSHALKPVCRPPRRCNTPPLRPSPWWPSSPPSSSSRGRTTARTRSRARCKCSGKSTSRPRRCTRTPHTTPRAGPLGPRRSRR